MEAMRHLLHRPASFQHGLDRVRHDSEVQPKVPFPDVARVQLYHFLKVRDVAAPADLPQPRDPRLERQARTMMKLVFLPLVHRRRPCPHQAHIAF